MTVTLTYSCNSVDRWANDTPTLDTTSTTLPFGGVFGTSGADPRVWIPFTIPFAQGKTIVSATLRVVASQTISSDEADFIAGCEAADTSATPTTAADLRAKVLTTSQPVKTQAGVSNGVEYTFDYTAAVQEVLNRAGWVAGNVLGILVYDSVQGNNHGRNYASSRHASLAGPKLDIVVNSIYIPHSSGLI